MAGERYSWERYTTSGTRTGEWGNQMVITRRWVVKISGGRRIGRQLEFEPGVQDKSNGEPDET